MKQQIRLFLAFTIAAVFLHITETPVSAQTPILEYKFNETGTSASSTGSNGTAATLINAAGTTADLHSADGLGVSGLSGDRAFDNTAATGMGSAGIGGVADIPANTFGTLTSLTLQCWFDASSTLGGIARIWDDQNFELTAGSSAGVLNFFINGTAAQSNSNFGQVGQWVFVAVTFDGTQTSNNVTFYEGTKTSPVVQVGLKGLNVGLPLDNHAAGIGNLSSDRSNARPFQGYIDDVRLFGSTTDNTGILTAAQLEAIRRNDVNPVPEPTTCVMVGLGILALFGSSHVRRRFVRSRSELV